MSSPELIARARARRSSRARRRDRELRAAEDGRRRCPLVYRSRFFLRQTFDLGGGSSVREDSNPLQLGTTVDSRRLVFTVGNFSVLDIFDKNNVTGDPRQTFFN